MTTTTAASKAFTKGSPQGRLLKSSALWLLCLLPCALAAWQWQRGASRGAELAALAAAAARTPLPVDALATAEPGRRAAFAGQLAGPALFWRQMDGRVRVWLPLRLADGRHLMVDAGQGEAGGELPARLSGSGSWQRWPRPFTLAGAVHGAAGEVDAPDTAALAVRYPGLLAGVLVMAPPLARLAASPLRPAFDPRRHYGYALQWLLLGLLLAPLAWRLTVSSRRTTP